MRLARTVLIGLAILGSGFRAFSDEQPVTISGTVRDSSGAAVSGAQVILSSAQSSVLILTDSSGEFSFHSVSAASGLVRVSAPGFSSEEKPWSTTSDQLHLAFTLQPAPATERVIVSATRSEVKFSEAPGSAVQLSTEDLAANPALTMDDILRQVPGFSLFRRSSSRVSNPTSQGVSLRGLGASGPSRALVLEDGVPLADPFGGWVYWDRIPRAELSSVEVFRGGASSLYGSEALGGVVQFLTRTATRPALSVDISYGTENTPDLSAWAGDAVGGWDFSTAIDMSPTDGYILVPASQRGNVDTAANSEHATVDGSLGHRIGERGRAFLRGTFFDESRHNGTPVTINSTGTGLGVAGINAGIGSRDWLSARIYSQVQGYDQTFSSIASDRNSEQLVNSQHVPSQQLGGGAQWNHLIKSHTLIAGLDLQEVIGASDERLFSSTPPGAQFATNIAGGRQRSTGIFGQDIFRIGKWTLIAGLRWDDWSNLHGSTVRIPVSTGTPTGTNFADRSETSFSPRLSLMRALSSSLTISLSGYRAFRAPTLNELYRTFRLGSITTNSNPLLRAERSTGAEAGLRQTAWDGRIEARGTVFWTDIVDPITNVSITATTRQRQNLGRTRSLGTELDGKFRLTQWIQISAGYQYTHATVIDSVPALIGLNVPEVPRHQTTWEARYWNPQRIMLSVDGRHSSLQYDDDLNTLRLGQYYVMDLFAGRSLRRGVTLYVAAENLLNQRYAVALSGSSSNPLQNLGPPILARAGVRFDFPQRD